MTFKITRDKDGSGKVQNTEGTTASFNQGNIKIGGDFENSGNVNVDVRANLDIIGNVLNSGNFNVKDYVTEKHYEIIESAINDLDGIPREHLSQSYEELKEGNVEGASSKFKQFVDYIKEHPELVTSSVALLLHLFR